MPILNDIIDWVQDKPKFWQVAVERLIRNNHLSESDISELQEICKSETGILKKQFDEVNFDELKAMADNSNSSKNVVLTKILNIENINALSSESTLEFSPNGLTVAQWWYIGDTNIKKDERKWKHP